MAKPVKVRTSLGQWEDLAINVPSANDPTFTGTTSSSQFNSTQSSGDEGGEIKFSKAATNTTLNTGVTLDVYQDRVRLFETGGTNRGGYIDMSTLSTGVGTNLVPGLTHINTTTFSSVASISIDNVFSSTYDNYRILFQITDNTDNNVQLNWFFRSSAPADLTSDNGSMVIAFYGGTTPQAQNTNNALGVPLINNSAGNKRNIYDIVVFNPLNTVKKGLFCSSAGTGWAAGGTQYITQIMNGRNETATAAAGIKFAVATGTFAGTISTYGFRK